MQDIILKYAFRALMGAIQKLVTEAQYKKLVDKILDAVEDFIEKDTSLDFADAGLKALVDQIRTATGVPDND